MPDYKSMYLKMMVATEVAMNILIDAQRECEEKYISAPESVANLSLVRNEQEDSGVSPDTTPSSP